MMVGVDANKAVTGVSVVSHAETSGIGTKVTGNDPLPSGVGVLDQFIGMSGAGTLSVGSNVTAISGATVSSSSLAFSRDSPSSSLVR
jgi:electron transport complex protein RnfG